MGSAQFAAVHVGHVLCPTYLANPGYRSRRRGSDKWDRFAPVLAVNRAVMMGFPSVQKRHQRTGVNDYPLSHGQNLPDVSD